MSAKKQLRNEYSINRHAVTIFLNRRDGTPINLIIDRDDWERIRDTFRRITIQRGRADKLYAIGKRWDNTTDMVHRFIMQPQGEQKCVSVTPNGFDCRKSNWRIVDSSRPICWNKAVNMRRYIIWVANRGAYRVRVRDTDGKHKCIGYTRTLPEAEKIRDEWVKSKGFALD